MANLILRPNANGDVTQLHKESCTYNYQCVDESGDGDGDTTYVASQAPTGWKYDLYNFPNHTTEKGTINSVTIYIRHKRGFESGSTASRGRTSIKIGGTTYYGATENPGTSYALHNTVYTENPQSTAAWTWDDIDALQAGYSGYHYAVEKNLSIVWCTQVWIDVDYTETPPSSGFWFVM